MEQGVDTMLAVVGSDFPELESEDEQAAANAFITNGALMLIAADGVVEPQKVAWLKAHTSVDRSRGSPQRTFSRMYRISRSRNAV